MKLNKTTYPNPKQFNRNNRLASFQPDWNNLREDVYYRDLSQRGKQPVSKPITIRELQTLLTPRPGPCISLYLPTHRRLPQAKQDPVRFKNLCERSKACCVRNTQTAIQGPFSNPWKTSHEMTSGMRRWA